MKRSRVCMLNGSLGFMYNYYDASESEHESVVLVSGQHLYASGKHLVTLSKRRPSSPIAVMRSHPLFIDTTIQKLQRKLMNEH